MSSQGRLRAIAAASQVLRALVVLTSCGVLVSAAQDPSRRATPAAGRGVIAGRVVDTKGAGVPSAEIMIGGPNGWFTRPGVADLVRRVLADEHGDFAFDGLPPGEYAFSASKPGYLEAMYNQRRRFGQGDTIPLRDGERRLDVTITLPKLSVITGTVIDETGAPISGAWVTAVRPVVRGGVWQLQRVVSDGTDDRGEYRLSRLEPGHYAIVIRDTQSLVIADPDGAGTRLLAYAPVMHPPTASAMDRRDLIRLDPGQEQSGVDLRIARVPAARLTGTVSGIEGEGITTINLRSSGDGLFAEGLGSRVLSVRPDGTFGLDGVLPGRYVLSAIRTELKGGMLAGRVWTATQPVIVGAAELDVSLTLRRSPNLSGRLVFDGAAPPPDAAALQNSFRVRTESADGNFEQAEPRQTLAFPEFSVTGFLPGRYLVRPPEQFGAWRLRAVTLEGRDVSATPLEIDAADIDDIVITYTDRPTKLSGVTRTAGGALQRDTFVAVFPTDSRLWVDYGSSPRRLLGMLAEADGTFTFELPAGEYFVVATPDDIRDAWKERSMLTRLAGAAVRAVVREGDDARVNPPMVTVR